MSAKVKCKGYSMGVSENSEPPNNRNIDSDKIKRKKVDFNDVHCTIKLFPNKKMSCTVNLAHPTRAPDSLKTELYPTGSEKKLRYFNQQTEHTRRFFTLAHSAQFLFDFRTFN